MANRNWMSGGKIFSMHKDPVMLDCTIAIGATGAVASIVGACILSVTRTGTGLYQINLQDNYALLLGAHASMQSASGALSGISSVEVQNAPSASVAVLAAPVLVIKTINAAGALADPVSGASINVIMMMSNSSLKIQGS